MLPLLPLLASCGRQVSRSIAPASSGTTFDLARSAAPNASGNQLPEATILSPAPDRNFTIVQGAPIRFEWTGDDPDGHLREYQYRVFGPHNPDFPYILDFVSYLQANPVQVLSYYDSLKWAGWEHLQVKKDTQPSATYSALLRHQIYAFVVVAIDNRGAHDSTLSRERNMIQFAFVPRPESPSITFVGPFGQVTGSEADGFIQAPVPPVPPPFQVSWFATPTPGTTIEGYLSHPSPGLMQPTSLGDTTATIPIPSPGNSLPGVAVEVEYDHGKRALYVLVFSSVAGTGSTRASRLQN